MSEKRQGYDGSISHRRPYKRDIINEHELSDFRDVPVNEKRDKLNQLSLKVKKFEDNIARGEALARAQGKDEVEAQNQVNEQYVKAIEAKLKILDKL